MEHKRHVMTSSLKGWETIWQATLMTMTELWRSKYQERVQGWLEIPALFFYFFALQWDQKDNWNKKRGAQKNTHLNELQKAIRSCRISFEIWEKTNADGKGSGQYDCTSLLGSDKKKLLKDLPSKLPGVIQSDCEHYPKTLAGLWCSLFHCCQQRTIRRRYDWLFWKSQGLGKFIHITARWKDWVQEGKRHPIHACHGLPYSNLFWKI